MRQCYALVTLIGLLTGGDTGGIVDNDWLTVRALPHLHVHVRHVSASLHAQSTWCESAADTEQVWPGGRRQVVS